MKQPITNDANSMHSFAALSAIILICAAYCLAWSYPKLQAYRLDLANTLAQRGQTANGTEAVANYQLASWLDSSNHLVRFNLAKTLLANGQANAALIELKLAGNSRDVALLRLRTQIETEDTAGAVVGAQNLAAADSASENDLILSCLAFAVAGQPADCQPLLGRVTSPEAIQSLKRVQVGSPLHLAAELYSAGLYKSSSAILSQMPVSFERNVLLGRIQFQEHTSASLNASRNLLETAIQLDPSSMTARQLLAACYRDLNEPSLAAQQDTLIAKLVSGRP